MWKVREQNFLFHYQMDMTNVFTGRGCVKETISLSFVEQVEEVC